MMAVVTTSTGGYDKMEFRRVVLPKLGPGELLLQVLAAGVNNTDINTRVGWYSASVTADTGATAAAEERPSTAKANSGWNAPTPFPIIQGTDCCGRMVLAAGGVNPKLVGRRALVRSCMRVNGFSSMETVWMGSDFDGAFAQFVKAPAGEVFPVDCDWSDAELGAIPCAYGTAENMLHRCGVRGGETVLVTGASGGVGSATVQLAKRRGATVLGMAGRSKHADVLAIGADRILDRDAAPSAELGDHSVDVVVDNVAGPGFAGLLNVLKRGGRYVSSGAIAGPHVDLDMRTFYLNDLTLIGSTAWDEPVFPNLIGYIERGEIRSILARTFPLEQIADAQRELLRKTHVGKLVLIPSHDRAKA
jgi:NADPH:quinone reductase-like Zn-dependent oxidoreductase